MLITVEQLQKFSGSYKDSDDVSESLVEIYIGTAADIINQYVGYKVEDKFTEVPEVFQMVCLEIATLLQQEESENIGVNSKSYAETGTRSFLNVVDYSKYLSRLSAYRANTGL